MGMDIADIDYKGYLLEPVLQYLEDSTEASRKAVKEVKDLINFFTTRGDEPWSEKVPWGGGTIQKMFWIELYNQILEPFGFPGECSKQRGSGDDGILFTGALSSFEPDGDSVHDTWYICINTTDAPKKAVAKLRKLFGKELKLQGRYVSI